MKSAANSFRLLPNGSAFFAAARDAIQSAAKSIRLESYIFARETLI